MYMINCIYDLSDDESSHVLVMYRAVVSLCLLHGCFPPEAADEGSEERIDDGLQEAFINPQQHRNNDAGNTNHTWTQHMNITHITICTII